MRYSVNVTITLHPIQVEVEADSAEEADLKAIDACGWSKDDVERFDTIIEKT